MIFELLVIYQLKHWLCDYPLQGRYMLGKFAVWPKWVMPLLCHAGVHSLFTFAIAYYYKPSAALWLALFDGVVHFTVDRIKASPTIGGRFTALSKKEMQGIMSYKDTIGLDKFKDQLKSNTYFWFALGADQMAHHLTHYFIIWELVK